MSKPSFINPVATHKTIKQCYACSKKQEINIQPFQEQVYSDDHICKPLEKKRHTQQVQSILTDLDHKYEQFQTQKIIEKQKYNDAVQNMQYLFKDSKRKTINEVTLEEAQKLYKEKAKHCIGDPTHDHCEFNEKSHRKKDDKQRKGKNKKNRIFEMGCEI
jgi:hypothetical protein